MLFRTFSHRGPLEIELTRRNVPFDAPRHHLLYLRMFFTEHGLDAPRVMMADHRLANPEKFAHIRQKLGLDG